MKWLWLIAFTALATSWLTIAFQDWWFPPPPIRVAVDCGYGYHATQTGPRAWRCDMDPVVLPDPVVGPWMGVR